MAAAAEARRAMVAATSGGPAVRAAVRALKEGGSAVDAALVAALMQPVLSAGSWNSYAGIFAMVCYDAGAGTVHSLNAAYDTPRRERHPQTIPHPGKPSGRSALIPGFMAGVQAAHDRFGRLPFARLFEPAIDLAERGFRVPSWFAQLLSLRRKVLTRLPESRRIFLDQQGKLYRTGMLFKQRELADTLRGISRHGAAYMYTGEWGRRFVRIVSREGGKITRDDLRRYRPIWAKPTLGRYHDYEICGPAPPGLGGINTIEALNLLQCADLFDDVHYSRSSRALYWLMQITHAAYVRRGARGADRAAARRLWQQMREKGGLPLPVVAAPKLPSHSDGVVVVDDQGNVVSICHSINSVAWGTSGIFVDGVSIPDSASFQQHDIHRTGPGGRLPEWMNPTIVLKDGEPVLASSCIGFSVHEMMIQCLVDVLDFGLTPRRVLSMPHFMLPVDVTGRRAVGRSKRQRSGRRRPAMKQLVQRSTFRTNVMRGVRARGQGLHIVGHAALAGTWAGIAIDESGSKLRGAVSSEPALDSGAVLGY